MANRAKGPLLLIVVIVLGLVAGSLLSQLLRPHLPFLTKAAYVGFEPDGPLVLGDVFRFAIGFRLRLDAITMAGLIAALVIYRRI